MLFATQTVQVTSEATARPIMTAFTIVSACRNMPQGERSCGKAAMATELSPACANAKVGATHAQSTPSARTRAPTDRPARLSATPTLHTLALVGTFSPPLSSMPALVPAKMSLTWLAACAAGARRDARVRRILFSFRRSEFHRLPPTAEFVVDCSGDH